MEYWRSGEMNMPIPPFIQFSAIYHSLVILQSGGKNEV